MDTEKCIACGLCASKCPKKVDDEYNEGLGKRKAIYVQYPQAVPLKYAIDAENCLFLNKNRCGLCEKNCPSNAINFKDTEKQISLNVGSVILAPGFDSFDPAKFDNLAFNTHPDIVTSLGFERMLSATGPSGGHLVFPSDKKHEKTPKKIAWLQCVGSREESSRCSNGYCSSVCCMYAVKQSIMAKAHSKDPLDCAIFYMDMRTHGKDFDKYLEKAKTDGVRFVRARVHTIVPENNNSGLSIKYVDESGNLKNEDFDVIVLSTGLEISRSSVELARRMGIELDCFNFIKNNSFNPVSTSVQGIYACGVFTGPKDIPQSVMEASAAASAATENLSCARDTKTKTLKLPMEKHISGQTPKIGVFVCNCGTNIRSTVDVPAVVEYASTLPGVIYAEENLFTCSQDTQDKMVEVIKEKGLNRVVVAACTPKTHEPLFRETLVNAGLNKYLFEMANIRNQDSWVHSNEPEKATQKAKDLVRMAVAKSFLLKPLFETKLPVTKNALVAGGGIAGMTAALALARQGYPVVLVEKAQMLGGNGLLLHKTFLDEDMKVYIKSLMKNIEDHELITVFPGATITQVTGFVGNFKTIIETQGNEKTISHGVAILATGAHESKPDEYLYGQNDSVMTNLEFDSMLKNNIEPVKNAKNICFIQCVGSRDEKHPYCSRVCCTHSVKNAIAIKKINPDVNVYILYREMRTYGTRELLYKKARELGVLFFRYDLENKPVVFSDNDKVTIEFQDFIIGKRLSLDADILCLASRIDANDNELLTKAFKVPCDDDGWMLEAHQKLRPVDFATDGVFLCGMAHYPKSVDESIAQAKAAVSRALTTLSKTSIDVGGIVSEINPDLCSGCMGCIEVCPYGAISMNNEKGVAEVNVALCKGCGACAAACPSEAPTLMGFNNEQLYAQIKSAMAA